jgi:hypothetical protein
MAELRESCGVPEICEPKRRTMFDLGRAGLGTDLSEFRDLRLIPDWPRLRKLVAQRLGKSEDEIQAMAESADSLRPVELAMAIEEGLGIRIDRYPQS